MEGLLERSQREKKLSTESYLCEYIGLAEKFVQVFPQDVTAAAAIELLSHV